MAADDAAVVVTLRASLKDYEAALKSAVRATERAAKASEDAFGNIGKKARPGNVIAVDFQKSFQAASADAKNLGFQINDLFTSIAGGSGVMRALAQQGGQISQIFSGMGMRAMGATITTALLDPFVLLSLAIPVATLAMGAFFGETEDGAKEAKKALDDQIDAINELRRVQGLKPLAPPTDVLAQFEKQRKALEEQAAAADMLAGKLKDAQEAITGQLGAAVLTGQADVIIELNRALDDLQRGIKDGNPDFVKFLETAQKLQDSDLSPAVKAMVKALIDLVTTAGEAQRNLKNLNETIDGSAKAADRAAAAAKKFAEGLAAMGQIAAAQVDDVQKLLELYQEAVKAAQTMGEVQAAGAAFEAGVQRISDQATDKEIREFVRGRIRGMIEQESGGAAGAQNPRSSATGLGQFIESTWLRLFPKVFPGLAAGASQQQQLAFRFDPEISRRMTEELAVENVKAMREAGAIIVDGAVYLAHFLGSEGAQKVLKAAPGTPVSQLVGAGALAANREVFAKHPTAGSLIEWAAGIEGGTNAARKAKTAYDDLVTSINAKIAAAERENAINADGTKSTDDKTAALAREKAAQEAATIAKQLDAATLAQYGTITDEQKAKNLALAESAAAVGLKAEELSLRNERLAESQRKATAEADKLSEAQKRARDALVNTLASMATSAITGFVQDLRNGVSAADALYNAISRIADQLLQMALNMMFQKLFGSLLGGLGGGPMGPGLFASGGYTGDRSTRAPAGIVHGQEFVINAQATKRHRALLESINKGVPGYASGGFVLPRMTGGQMMPSQQAAPQVNTRTTVVNTFDAGSFLSEALSRPTGVNVILNAVRAQPGAFRQAMQG